jgi:hypothetical protein
MGNPFRGVLEVSIDAEAPEVRVPDALGPSPVFGGCVLVHSLGCLCAQMAALRVEVLCCNGVRTCRAFECGAVVRGFDCVISHG